jgi:hypothetical protein
MLNNGNSQSYQTCFRNFVQISTMLMKQTGLFYRATLDGSLSYKDETLSGAKKAIDHVIVLCCLNISVTDTWKLLVIGKRAKPRCFMGISMDSLSVLYYANKIA